MYPIITYSWRGFSEYAARHCNCVSQDKDRISLIHSSTAYLQLLYQQWSKLACLLYVIFCNIKKNHSNNVFFIRKLCEEKIIFPENKHFFKKKFYDEFFSLRSPTPPTNRAGLNEREAPGKVLTARPPKRLAQLRSVSHALVSTWQKHRSKTSKQVENLTLAAKFRLINLIVAMTLYLPS